MLKCKAYGKKLKSLNENGNSKKVCSRLEDCEKVPVFFVLLLNEKKIWLIINDSCYELWLEFLCFECDR